MNTSKTDIAVAVYDSHIHAEAAVRALQRAGFDMKKISIIGKEFHTEEHVIGYFNAGDRAKVYGKYGAFWGGLMGVLFGSAMMFVPVVGHLEASLVTVRTNSQVSTVLRLIDSSWTDNVQITWIM